MWQIGTRSGWTFAAMGVGAGCLIWSMVLVNLLAQPARADLPVTENPRVLQERADRLIVTLPNGLIVVAQELRTAPIVTAQVWIKTGSIYEQEHVGAGLSHFLEHLASGGSTDQRTEDESNAILGRIGARTNAATGLDKVHYYINTTAPFAADAVELISDWMQHSKIEDVEFNRERDVIQREFDMGRGDPNRILWKLTQQARFARSAHPARHPTIGYLDEFLSITRDEIFDFYKRMYVPNNMVFVVVGDIDKQAIVDQVAQLWADSKPGELPALTLPIEPPVATEGDDADANAQPTRLSGSADIQRTRLRIAWPGTRLTGEHDYALDLLATILGQGESSRLVRAVRDDQRLVNTIQSYNLSFTWGEGYFGVDAELADADNIEEKIGGVETAILAQVETMRTELVSDAELARAKRQTLARTVYGSQTAQDLASDIARNLIGLGDPDYDQRYVEAIQKLTAEELRAAAQHILQPDKRIVITLEPAQAAAPASSLTRPEDEPAPGIEHEPVDLDNRALVAAMEKVFAQSEADPAEPIVTDPIEQVTLSNGLRVLLGRSTLVPAVSVQCYSLGGLLGETPGREGVASAMTEMMMRGTTTRSAEQIAETLENLGAGMATSSGNNTLYVTAQALRDDLPTVLDLMADVMLRPSFPDDEWAKLQPRLLAAIGRIGDRWNGELQQDFRTAYFGDHPWSQTSMGRESVVAELTTEDLRAYHAGQFSADQSILSVFGDFDRDAVVRQLEKLFAAMPAQSAVKFDPPMTPKQTARVVTTQTGKPLVATLIGFGPGITISDDDYPAMLVLNRVISSFPTGWIDRALRGSDGGLVYAVGAYNSTGLVPGYYGVIFNTQPDSAVEALRRSMAVIERAKTETIDDDTLARAKAGVLTDEFIGNQSNSQRAAQASLDVLYGLGLERPQWLLDQIQSIDSATLQAVAQRRLNNPVAVVMSNVDLPLDEMQAVVRGDVDDADTVEAENTDTK